MRMASPALTRSACQPLKPPGREANEQDVEMLRLLAAVSAAAIILVTPVGAAPPVASPLLAFSAERSGNSDIYVAALDGTGLRRLTTGPGADFDPSWSPDRRQVAYRCQVGASSDICVVGAEGGDPVDITDTPGDEWSPAWSPNGRWIAFFSDRADQGSLWLMHPDGSAAHRLVGGGEYPAWSPDGRLLAYADMPTRDLAIVRADGSHKRLLARSPAYDMSPSTSLNGRLLAFDSQRGFAHVRERGIGPEFEIYRVGIGGGNVRRLTRNRSEDRFPDFGPGGRIVFSRGGQLWITGSDGRHARRLPLHGSFPDW
jgi:Tol biopolymer transport system component